MAIATYYLRGDEIGPVEAIDGRIEVNTYRDTVLMAAVVDGYSGMIHAAEVGIAADGTVVLKPARVADDKSRELILVNEYSPGVGHKRWPDFYVDFDSFGVEILESAVRYKGSGYDEWSLVLAPAGTAKYIASNFINVRDYPSQTISAPAGGL